MNFAWIGSYPIAEQLKNEIILPQKNFSGEKAHRCYNSRYNDIYIQVNLFYVNFCIGFSAFCYFAAAKWTDKVLFPLKSSESYSFPCDFRRE